MTKTTILIKTQIHDRNWKIIKRRNMKIPYMSYPSSSGLRWLNIPTSESNHFLWLKKAILKNNKKKPKLKHFVVKRQITNGMRYYNKPGFCFHLTVNFLYLYVSYYFLTHTLNLYFRFFYSHVSSWIFSSHYFLLLISLTLIF